MKNRLTALLSILLTAGITLCTVSTVHSEDQDHSQPDPLELLRGSLKVFDEQVQDYTATFIKQQRINGKLYNKESMRIKFMKPLAVYYRWNYPDRGKEVIYVEGKNKNRLIGHFGGAMNFFPISKWMNPEDPVALKGNKYPITRSGIGNMLKLIIGQYELAQENGDLVSLYAGTEEVDGRPTHVLIRKLPQKDIYACYVSIVNIDVETQLPVRVVSINWDFTLEEYYQIKDLRINQGLTDKDFNPNSRKYNFGILKF